MSALEQETRRETRREAPHPIHLRLRVIPWQTACGSADYKSHANCSDNGTEWSDENYCAACGRPICPCCLIEVGAL